jgi:hypothetical protein
MGKPQLSKIDDQYNASFISSFYRMLYDENASALAEYSVVIATLSIVAYVLFISISLLFPHLYQTSIHGMQDIQSYLMKKIP